MPSDRLPRVRPLTIARWTTRSQQYMPTAHATPPAQRKSPNHTANATLVALAIGGEAKLLRTPPRRASAQKAHCKRHLLTSEPVRK